MSTKPSPPNINDVPAEQTVEAKAHVLKVTKDVLKRLVVHVYQGLPLEQACAAEMMGDQWRQQLSRSDILELKKAEALFMKDRINKLLSSKHAAHVNAAKIYIASFGKEFNKRRLRMEYAMYSLLQTAKPFVDSNRWDEFLDALSEHDTEDVVYDMDEILKAGGGYSLDTQANAHMRTK